MFSFTPENLKRQYLKAKYGFNVPDLDGMMNYAKCVFLYDMVMNYEGLRTHIVEIGPYKGCSTTWLGIAAKRKAFKSLIAIDLFTGTPGWEQKFDTYQTFIIRMQKNKLENFVEAVRGDSREVIKAWDKAIAILHIDSDHRYDAVKADIDNFVPYIQDDGIIIFDDYDASHPDVKKAVQELLDSGRFQVAGKVEEIRGEYGSIALKKVSA